MTWKPYNPNAADLVPTYSLPLIYRRGPWRYSHLKPPDSERLSLFHVKPHPDLDWFALAWEVLGVKARPTARPWCCYIRTVIFYDQEYTELERTEHTLEQGSIVLYQGREYRAVSGRCLLDGEDRWCFAHTLDARGLN